VEPEKKQADENGTREARAHLCGKMLDLASLVVSFSDVIAWMFEDVLQQLRARRRNNAQNEEKPNK